MFGDFCFLIYADFRRLAEVREQIPESSVGIMLSRSTLFHLVPLLLIF